MDAGRAVNGITAISWYAPTYGVRIHAVSCVIVTDATVANRFWGMRVSHAGADLALIPNLTAQTASSSIQHFYMDGYGYPQSSLGSYMVHPFPLGGLIVPGEARVQYLPITGQQAGDAVGPWYFMYSLL